ncbi:MAG: methyltransferase domain-containing protein [Candidatus Promineifilaceae bacterium]
MTFLLFPGRHLLNTSFQARYLQQILQMPLAQLTFLAGAPPPASGPLDQVVFAITSSNQAGSRYNPIPLHVRAIGVDRFIRPFEATLSVHYRIIGIPHYQPTPRFAEFTLKEIAEQTEGGLRLTPDNCVVLCSTTAVIRQYQQLGFAILPAELNHPDQPPAPIDVLQKMVAAGESWPTHPDLRDQLSSATFDLWQDFPDIPRRILRLWRDPLLNDEGSLTNDRNYATYAYGLSNPEIINLKYQDIQEAIVPGKIVDEGCADGALLAAVAHDFPDSDLIGIDISAEFIARCRERQRAGDFGGSFVFFHQRNITQPIFEPGAIHTTICNSTLHELWSYGDQAQTIHSYLALKYAQTAVSGRLLIRDVIGPENGRQEVYLWLNDADGANDAVFQEFASPDLFAEHLQTLSTYGRFRRFARDFLPDRQAGQPVVQYQEAQVDGRQYAILPLRAACEFMSKKDYTDNWASEMHEEFAFWSFSDWKTALQTAGFHILENPNTPQSGSRVYTNPWIVSHRWQGKVALFVLNENGRLDPLPYPPTNVILVAEK